MPDRFGFNHEPHRGLTYHRCIDCDEYPWGVRVTEDERRLHFEQHERERSSASDRRRLEALAVAQQTQQLVAREAAILEERTVAPPTRSTKGVTMAAEATDNGQLAEDLRVALLAIPSKLVEKKAYHRIDQNGLTLGYAYLGVRQPSVEVPTGHGSYERQSVTSKQDITVVLNKLQAVADRAAAKKAASTEAKAAAKPAPKPKAKAASKGETGDEVTPDPKPARARKPRAKATV
jgi:hypothetical protein